MDRIQDPRVREILTEMQEDNDAQLAKIQKGYERWAHITFIILGTLVLLWIFVGLATYYIRDQNRQRIIDIQQSRLEFVRDSCRAQNNRHDETIIRVRTLTAKAMRTASPARRRQLQMSVTGTIFLVDALAPKQDCNALVTSIAVGGDN